MFVFSINLNAQVDEEKIFVYHLIKFTNWSEDILNSEKAFNIGVYNNEEVAAEMADYFNGKKCYDKKIVVSNLTNKESISNFNLIFLPENQKSSSKMIIERCSDYGIITISLNNASFCKKGGIVNFVYTRKECAFQINNNAAVKNKIFFSTQLLNIAEIVN